MEEREAAEKASNKDQDEMVDLEIRYERSGATDREPLKLTVTLKHGGSELSQQQLLHCHPLLSNPLHYIA